MMQPAITTPFPSQDHVTITPSILYFGTPVVLITTLNADGTVNISPISSAWALGDRVVLGMGSAGHGVANLRRDGRCVLNFPCAMQWQAVEKIARTTGCNPVPPHKAALGFVHEPDKFTRAGFTPVPSVRVPPPRIRECPLQFEAHLCSIAGDDAKADRVEAPLILETRILHVHAHPDILIPGSHHIDTNRWSPLLYVFRHYHGTGPDLGKNFRAEY